MMKKPVFKLFIWFIASSIFFLASAILISSLNPNPSSTQVMKYMSGMMAAMDNSLMGLSMSIEEDYSLKTLISAASSVTYPLIILGFLGAVFIRIRRN